MSTVLLPPTDDLTSLAPTSGLLAGRRIVVTGVLTESSIAFSVARLAQREGAEIVLTAPAKTTRITRRIANRLDTPAPVT